MADAMLLRFAAKRETTVDAEFRRLYDEHHAAAWRVLLRLLGREAVARDALQETFLVVLRQRDRYDATRAFRPWLLGIAVNVARGYRRAERRFHLCGDEALDAFVGAQTPPDDNRAAHRIVMQALAEVPFDFRIVLVLCDIEDMAGPEVAVALQVPIGTVYSRLARGRAAFTAAIRRLEST